MELDEKVRSLSAKLLQLLPAIVPCNFKATNRPKLQVRLDQAAETIYFGTSDL